MNWTHVTEWLINTIGFGTVAGSVYALLEWIRRWIDRRPIVWAIVRITKVTHTTWIELHVRNRDQSDIFIETIEILFPLALKIEDRSGRAARILPIGIQLPPCPPYANELPSAKYAVRCEEPVGVIKDRLTLRVALHRARRWRPIARVTVQAVVSRPRD